ncbi:methyltransferase domain-containing protein [Mycobacterium sp. PS03-16]|nr:methyltransferase domain-containing protein [Mycobacterium sp. PS03-16]
METMASESLGMSLRGLEILEVGAGQQLLRLKYFSRNNNVTALDYDIIVQGFDPAAYMRVFRSNGPKRTLKTVLRKLAGIDRSYWSELEKHIGRVRSPLNVVQGDAHAMPWPDSSFDFIYSFSVFEHVNDPAKCLDEVIRVLKPGGVFCISTHMYTSDSGAHDPRSFLPRHADLAPWAHLRPAHQNSVKPNAYCNAWRNGQWEDLFQERCPGVSLRNNRSPEWLVPELAKLRSAGELAEYSDDELLTCDLWALWQKPSA